jgi:hypothetical protein
MCRRQRDGLDNDEIKEVLTTTGAKVLAGGLIALRSMPVITSKVCPTLNEHIGLLHKGFVYAIPKLTPFRLALTPQLPRMRLAATRACSEIPEDQQRNGIASEQREGRIRFADRVESHLCWTNLRKTSFSPYCERRAITERSLHVKI